MIRNETIQDLELRNYYVRLDFPKNQESFFVKKISIFFLQDSKIIYQK